MFANNLRVKKFRLFRYFCLFRILSSPWATELLTFLTTPGCRSLFSMTITGRANALAKASEKPSKPG